MRLLLALKRGSYMSALLIIILLSFLFPYSPFPHPSCPSFLISFYFPSPIRQPSSTTFYQFFGTAKIYRGSGFKNPSRPQLAQFFNKIFTKILLFSVRRSIDPRKIRHSFFIFVLFDFSIPFYVGSGSKPIPEPECIPVPVPLRQKS